MNTAHAIAAIALVTFAGIIGCAPKQAPVAAAASAPSGEFFANGASTDACGFAMEITVTDATPTARETGIGMGADCDAAWEEAREVATSAALSSAGCDAEIIELSVVRSSFHPADGVSVEVDATAACRG